MFTLKLRVVGVKFKNSDGTHRQHALGLAYDDWWTEGREDDVKVRVERDKNNAHDPHAVSVWLEGPEEAAGQIGFISADRSEFVAQIIEDGRLGPVAMLDMGCAGRGALVWAKIAIGVRDEDDSPDDEDEYLIEDDEGRVYEIE